MTIAIISEEVRYLLKMCYLHGIRTNEAFFSLTEEELREIEGIEEEQIELFHRFKHVDIKKDIFASYRIEKLTPTRMAKFFQEFNLTSENILQTKLTDLMKQHRITKGRVNAFLHFKHTCIRHVYSDTLNPKMEQNQDEAKSDLIDLFAIPLKPYLKQSTYELVKTSIRTMLDDVQLENVDIEKYGEEIVSLLDYEYYLQIDSSSFLEDLLYQVIINYRKGISMFLLKQKLQQLRIFPLEKLDETLQKLLNNGFIVYTPHGIKHHYPKVIDFIERNVDEFEIVYHRLHGKTLEEIGEIRGVTRERIRQLEGREAKKIPFQKVYEYRYVPFFQRYDLTKDEFKKVFQLDSVQYEFLKLFFSKDEWKEKESKEQLLESQTLSLVEQEALLAVINKDYLIIDNKRIKKNKFSIIKHCVKEFAQETIKMEDFQREVFRFCDENGISDEFDFSSIKAIDAHVSRVDSILRTHGRQFRYYGVDEQVIRETLKEINFNRYYNQEISTKKILIDYETTLAEIEIADEYELHNLLKKYNDCIPDYVSFGRMPILEVGDGDREEQLLDLLIECSPITKDDFALAYSERYGVLIETVKANYLPLLRDYEDGELLNADTPVIPEKTLTQLKEMLTKDFYFKEDVYHEYRKTYGNEKLPDYIFHQIGYRNYVDFILKDTYRRADLYFKETYFNEEIFTIEDKRLLYVGSFRKTLDELRESMELFEFDKNEFIRFSLLQERAGIEKSDIIELVNDILDEVGDKYFTVDTVEHLIERSKLHRLGFGHMFYESILKGHEALRFQYMGNKTVFRRTREKFFIYDLIEETVSRFKRIDIYDLMEYLEETYAVSLAKEKIIQVTDWTNLYYHPVMEMMFQDVDEFYEMMEE